MKIILVTGGFDPLHSGHIAYFNAASTLGDKLVVGLNSDDWLSRKKGQQFMPFDERATIVKSLSVVDEVISFDDADDTACGAIFKVLSTHGSDATVVFANGGDRQRGNIRNGTNDFKNVEFVFGIGGKDKRIHPVGY